MIKNSLTLTLVFCVSLIYSQDIVLLKNFNPKVKELKHDLNETKDSLLLSCDSKILKVEIFNEDYEETLLIDRHQTQISLHNLPVGKFVVETSLSNKVVLMDIIRYEDHNETTNSSNQQSKDIAEGQSMMLDESLRLVTRAPKHSLALMLNRGKANKQKPKKQKFYWTITKINTESGSSKTMKLVDQATADRLIAKNKLEHSSASGKLNELLVWEVYDTSNFMQRQVSNSDFIYTSKSEFFNPSPYYSTEINRENI